MYLDYLNWTLWVGSHGRYWYQSFLDRSNIWGVDSTDPWDPEMDHPPLGRSYLVVESSCYIVTRKRNSSAAAKYELYIPLPAEQRCSKKCVAALQADTFVYLSLFIYIYINIFIRGICFCNGCANASVFCLICTLWFMWISNDKRVTWLNYTNNHDTIIRCVFARYSLMLIIFARKLYVLLLLLLLLLLFMFFFLFQSMHPLV